MKLAGSCFISLVKLFRPINLLRTSGYMFWATSHNESPGAEIAKSSVDASELTLKN